MQPTQESTKPTILPRGRRRDRLNSSVVAVPVYDAEIAPVVGSAAASTEPVGDAKAPDYDPTTGLPESPQALAQSRRKRGPPESHVAPYLTSINGTKIMTGLGATSIWALIKAGELRTARFGRRTLIEVQSIHEAIARRLAAAQAGKAE
jgi:hypothetical protein